MTEQTITLSLPEPVLRKLQRAALLTYRSVDEVVASTIDAVLVAPEGLPAELADELAAMHLLSDDALWAAAQPSLSPSEQERLAQLNHRAGERKLSAAEIAEHRVLLDSYHRSLLRRAQALSVLAQRGHSIVPPSDAETGSNGDTGSTPKPA